MAGARTFARHSHSSLPLVFRRNLLRVLTIQAVSLAVLWLMQARYHGRG